MKGFVEMAEEVLGLPCRLGVPRHVGWLDEVVHAPQYATGLGLVLYGLRYRDLQPERRFRIRESHLFEKVYRRMREWWVDLKAALF